MWVEEREEASARCWRSPWWARRPEPGAVRTPRGRGAQPTLCEGWQVPTNDNAGLNEKAPFLVPGIIPTILQNGSIHFLSLR